VLPLTYSLGSGAPAGASIDASTGVFTWTPVSNQPTGLQYFTLTVSDNSNPAKTSSQTLTVHVYPAGTILPPTLATLPPLSVTAGQPLSYNLASYASAPTTPPLPLTFSLGSGAPTGASIDPSTGVLTWAVSPTQASGPVSFTVIVSDNEATPQAASG